jgi:hypothetical protein
MRGSTVLSISQASIPCLALLTNVRLGWKLSDECTSLLHGSFIIQAFEDGVKH